MKKPMLGKHPLERRPRAQLDKLSLKVGVTHRPTHSSQQKPGREMGLPKKDLWIFCLMVWTLGTSRGDPQKFRDYHRNQLGWKGAERG